MLNGKTNKQIILDILSDMRPHYDREFLNAGICEYRRRISDLREEGYVIESLWIVDPNSKHKRPGYQLIHKPGIQEDLFNAA